MITLQNNILYTNGEPLFRFDSTAECVTYMHSIGYIHTLHTVDGVHFSK